MQHLISIPQFPPLLTLNMSRITAFPLIIIILLLSSPFFVAEGCPPHELTALLTFKSTLHDPQGMLNSWIGDRCCSWRGVKCIQIEEGIHVSKLDLGRFELESEKIIVSSLLELKYLHYLDLSGNYFHGEIPSELGNFSSLRHLDLSTYYNLRTSNLHWLSNLSSLEYLSLSGVNVSDKSWESIIGSLLHLEVLVLYWCSLPLPPNTSNAPFILSSLAFLDLSGNSISNVPAWIENLSSLTHLDLSINSISNIPAWIVNLPSLTHLYVGENSISNIPAWMVNLSSLTLLYLSRNNISGSIPNTVGKLSSSLTHLYLAGNIISGSIPYTIGSLTRLEYLDLSSNALTGQIHPALGHNRRQYESLYYLNLGGNNLEGTIPSSLGLLTNLTNLYLERNQLRGNIPPTLGDLHKLTELRLYSNQLSGSLPLSVSHLSSLTSLDASHNHLNGSIHSALMLPASLQRLDLSDNSMNGTITEVFFHKSLRLKYLDLSHSGLSINISSTWIPSFQLGDLVLRKCQIGGPIPSWISTQFSLYQLDLSATQLMGDLPSWLWDIVHVDLSDNRFQGSFTPTSGSLRYLDLSMNELSGRLPADIHMLLSNAEMLILADNKIGGKIPTSIANLTNLSFLDLSNNCLRGNVPATMGNLTSLTGLHLGKNYLEGEIPKELGSLSNLESLRIGKNSLEGVLPSFLRNLSSLKMLDVGQNNLIGSIPQWIANFSSLQVLVMRSNNLRGILPPDIGRLPELRVLDLSSNFFSGMIPHSYFKFPAMQKSSAYGAYLSIDSRSFDYHDNIDMIIKGHEWHYQDILSTFICIDLSNNGLSGPLPPEIDNLKGLMYLNLSMNNLSGPIPQSLGNLVQLESVDLSSNRFSGHIPWQLGNLTYLAYLNLSCNNLSGRIPQQGGQMLTFGERSYIGNPNLWGCPLERNCTRPVARLSPPPAVGVEEKREEGLEIVWYWMCLGLSWGLGFGGVVMVLVLKLSWRIRCFKEMDRAIETIDRMICMLPKLKPKPMQHV